LKVKTVESFEMQGTKNSATQPTQPRTSDFSKFGAAETSNFV